MAIIEWSDELVLGQEQVDGQHKQLIDEINSLEGLSNAARPEDVEKALMFLAQYVGTHFQDEEKLMHELGYPGLAEHRVVHQGLYDQVEHRIQEFLLDGQADYDELVGFLRAWLSDHILTADAEIARWAVKNCATATRP